MVFRRSAIPSRESTCRPSVPRKVKYTGYLKRDLPQAGPAVDLEKIADPFLLVTVGGGGDGEDIVDWVLRAYEYDSALPYPALVVLGPFMGTELQAEFQERAARLPKVETITFDTHPESLFDRAAGIVSMGGYNTFCEILSFDKPSLIVPRTVPRREQFIRASRAQDLGLVKMIMADSERDAATMATLLRGLPLQPKPSEVVVPGLLDGRDNVIKLTRQWLSHRRNRLSVAEGSATRVAGT